MLHSRPEGSCNEPGEEGRVSGMAGAKALRWEGARLGLNSWENRPREVKKVS